MKRVFSILLCGALALSLAACSQPTQSSGKSQSGSQSQQPAQSQPEEQSAGEGGDRTLVVYYSASGNTERVAKAIAETLHADTFVLTPVDPYSDADLNWTDGNSRVSREHENESLRDIPLVSATPDSWDGYDTVFIGYPIWWGIAAWPTDSFVKANDFTGKTVIPFCTSASSGLGQSGQLLAELAGAGDWRRAGGSPAGRLRQTWWSGSTALGCLTPLDPEGRKRHEKVGTPAEGLDHINIVDFDFFSLEVYNHCENSNAALMTIEPWADIHPLLKVLPVEWDYRISFGPPASGAPGGRAPHGHL